MPPTTRTTDPFHFLGTADAHHTAHAAAWRREEARLYGLDTVIGELTQFMGEEAASFDLRQRTARYLNFSDTHASILSGHLRRAMPMPTFGRMGEVRSREKVTRPSLAELFWYNCDGIGYDGTQFPTFMDGVVKRACATGYRWITVEMPTMTSLRATRLARGEVDQRVGPLTEADMLAGFRPWLVERSPLAAERHRIINGALEYVVFTVPMPPENDAEAVGSDPTGWYIQVRRGCARLGDYFKGGGWWLVDPKHVEVDSGTWDSTDGEIPTVRAVAEYSQGTYDHPAEARSLTMELGQIGVDVMNARSEQRYNARQAAKSVNWLLGVGGDAQSAAAAQAAGGSILVAVPPYSPDGGKSWVTPTMWNSSAAALDTGVYTNIIKEAIEEAKEIMVKQVTSEPGSSGVSKEAGFEEANAPLLARLATATEGWVNSILYFFGRRAGLAVSDATLTMPRQFNLRQVLDDVDSMIDTMRRAALSSPTWERALLVRKGDHLGLLPDDDRKVILAELDDAAQKKLERSEQMASLYQEMDGTDLAARTRQAQAGTQEDGNGGRPGVGRAVAARAGAGDNEES